MLLAMTVNEGVFFRTPFLTLFILTPLDPQKGKRYNGEKGERRTGAMKKYRAYEGMGSGDVEIDKRVAKTLEQISSKPSAPISRACGDVHQSKAVYRLLSNEKFKSEQVTKVSGRESIEAIEKSGAETVLAVQDTSVLNYTKLRSTSGLGTISSNKKSRGLVLHNALAVGTDNEIYGILGQEVIVREVESYGKRHERKKKRIEEKESNKWLTMMEKSEKLIPKNVACVHVSDRESDIYEYFERCESIGSKYLCRRTRNRCVADEHHEINRYIDSLAEAGVIEVQVPRDSHTKRKAREAKLSVRFGKTEVMRPANMKASDKTGHGKLTVYVISAVEKCAPPGVKEPICWQLITNLPVLSFDEAAQKIDWYTKRWRIEDFHYTLKSGCAIEKRQASSGEKLEKLIALYSVIAVDILRMTWLARVNPDLSCELLFSDDEWKILCCVATKTRTPPALPPSIYQAVRFIAILGGFLNRNSDGEPGVKSVWIGLSVFRSILFAKQFC